MTNLVLIAHEQAEEVGYNLLESATGLQWHLPAHPLGQRVGGSAVRCMGGGGIPMGAQKQVVVIGGGIAGLSAARQVALRARELQIPVSCVLLEATNHLGGHIRTERSRAGIIELGPDSLFLGRPGVREWLNRLGLTDRYFTLQPGLRI